MIVEGAQSFAAVPEAVWGLLLDPEVMAKAMPGTRELVLVGPERYRGRMVVTVGPITAAEFTIEIALADLVPPQSFVMEVDGTGRFGFTRGRAAVRLEPEGAGTVMSYRADLHVGGKIAAVGQRLLDLVSRTMVRAGLEALGKELTRRIAGDDPGGSAE